MKNKAEEDKAKEEDIKEVSFLASEKGNIDDDLNDPFEGVWN